MTESEVGAFVFALIVMLVLVFVCFLVRDSSPRLLQDQLKLRVERDSVEP
jgi:hypothetical protein